MNQMDGKDDFLVKLDELIHQPNCEWTLILLDGDNIGDIKRKSFKRASNIIDGLKIFIEELFLVNCNDACFGYHLGSDNFGLICEKDCIAVSKLELLMKSMKNKFDVTISAGVAKLLPKYKTKREWYERADINLLRAKENGKNCFFVNEVCLSIINQYVALYP